MKILVFYQYFGTPKGKWSTRMYELTRRWVEAGHEVTVVTSPYEKSDIRIKKFIEKLTVDGINLIVINSADSNRYSSIKRIVKSIIFSIVSCYYALFLKYDVVLASSGPITIGLPALIAKWLRNKPMVFEVRDLWPEGAIELGKMKNKSLQLIAKWFAKKCYQNSALVVPCSEGMKEGVLKVWSNSQVLVIPNASDNLLFSKNYTSNSVNVRPYNEKKIFLYAGSLGLMDEVQQVIEAMKLIDDPKIKCVIIGDGVEKPLLEKLVVDYSLKNVEFIGIMPKEEIVDWFSKSWASFVTFKNLNVLHTSSPNKMFDSFAAGVPIIQTTKGWIKDLIDKFHCGINVEPNKPEDLKKAILKMANDEDFRNALAVSAKNLALNEFDRDKLAYKYLNALKGLQKNEARF